MWQLLVQFEEDFWEEAGVFSSREAICIYLRNLSYERDFLDYRIVDV